MKEKKIEPEFKFSYYFNTMTLLLNVFSGSAASDLK